MTDAGTLYFDLVAPVGDINRAEVDTTRPDTLFRHVVPGTCTGTPARRGNRRERSEGSGVHCRMPSRS
jgi:hypothetical protein